MRDINWSVSFEITVNGESVNFWDLEETEQEEILNCIKEDHYSGTFFKDFSFAAWKEMKAMRGNVKKPLSG